MPRKQWTAAERYAAYVANSDRCSDKIHGPTYLPTEEEIAEACNVIKCGWSDEETDKRLGCPRDWVPTGMEEWMVCPACQKPSEYGEPGEPPVRCLSCLRLEQAILEGRYSKLGYHYSNSAPQTADMQYHGGGGIQADHDVWWEHL